MTRAEFAVLARLDGYKLRALWLAARRDRLFLAGSLLIVAFLAFGAPYKFVDLLKERPAVQLLLALAFGAVSFLAVAPQPGSRAALELANGPFQPLVSTPLAMSAWLALRSLMLLLCAGLPLTVALMVVAPMRAIVFMALAYLGAGLTAAAYVALGSARTATVVAAGPPRLIRRHPKTPLLLLLNVAARRRLGPPVWLIVPALAAFAVAAAPLAARNNDEPGVGASLAAIAAVLAGASLFSSPRLVLALARQPAPLPRLYGWLFGVAIAVATVIGLAGSVLSGAGPRMVLEVAASAGGATAAIGLVYMLHALTRAPRVLPSSLAAEAFALNLFFTYMSLLWPLWVVLRLFLLIRAARRQRWLDR